MTAFFRKLAWLVRRRAKEAELAEELRFHLEAEAEEHQEAGLPETEARLAARRQLGNVGLVEEEIRAAWGWTLFEQLMQDLRYGVRAMARNPAFTALAALSLALGMGANTAIYSFMDTLLMRSLPVQNPQQLVVLNWHNKLTRGTVFRSAHGNTYDDRKFGIVSRIFPYPAFELFQRNDSVFSALFAHYPTHNVNLLTNGRAEIGSGEYVSGDYFKGLEISPAAGRLISPDDDRAGSPPVVVLGFDFSQRRFGTAAGALGQSILINNIAFTVAGVTPPGFFGVNPAIAAQFFIPVHTNTLIDPNWRNNGVVSKYLADDDYWIEIMGRLRPGATMTQAQATLAPVFARWVGTTAKNDFERKNLPGLHVSSGATGLDTLRRRYSEPLYVLLAMVGLILAIACANIANLLLARATSRRREIAVRLSMGAGRGRVIRQLLTESVLLASVGGSVGVLFAIWGVRFLTTLLASGNDGFNLYADLNWHVLAATATLSMTAGVLFGLAPALQATRVDVLPALKETRASERQPHLRRLGLSQLLVASQIAFSLVLLVTAGLFVRSLLSLQSVELGFQRENLLLFKLNARQAGHREPEIVSFYSSLQRRFAAIPGVRSTAMSNAPLVGEGTWGSPVYPLGSQPPEQAPDGHGRGASALSTHILAVGPGFFTSMGIPLVAGREFDDRDRGGSRPVAIVNQAWAAENFGRENPIGQQLVLEIHSPDLYRQQLEVVGVAKNARYGELTEQFPAVVYLVLGQNLYYPLDEVSFALRTSGDPLNYANTVHEIVHQADSRVPVMNLKTQDAVIDQIMNAEIIFARLCTGFAILALVIACVGLYGTMSYLVARRTGEFGIRMALGARATQVIWMILAQVMVVTLTGVVIGAPLAYASSHQLQSLLYRVTANDPMSLGVGIVTLAAAAIVAGLAPAIRASRVDPMLALRHE